MTSLPGEERPRTPLAPADERATILPLSIPVVIVAAPARAERGVHLQHRVHNPEGIRNERIVGSADAMTHELEKAGVDDVLGWKDALRPGPAVRNGDESPIRVLFRVMIVCPLRQ